MRPVFVLSAARTPIGKFGGVFASMSAADLGEVAAKAAIERSGAATANGSELPIAMTAASTAELMKVAAIP